MGFSSQQRKGPQDLFSRFSLPLVVTSGVSFLIPPQKRKNTQKSVFSFWRRRWDSPLSYRKLHWSFLPIGSHTASLLEFVSHPTSKNKNTPEGVFFFGGDGGIRTHVPVKANAFRVRPVMTTSIRLRIYVTQTSLLL